MKAIVGELRITVPFVTTTTESAEMLEKAILNRLNTYGTELNEFIRRMDIKHSIAYKEVEVSL